MTVAAENAMIYKILKIEVADFKSIFSDVAGTGEEKRKGRTPKDEKSWASSLGHAVKNRMTVTWEGGALSRGDGLWEA